jgi:hypothetical protein
MSWKGHSGADLPLDAAGGVAGHQRQSDPPARAGGLRLAILTDNRDATAKIPEAASNMHYRTTLAQEEARYVIAMSGGPL